MRLKRRIAAMLAFIMAFSSVATFSFSADGFAPLDFVPFEVTTPTDLPVVSTPPPSAQVPPPSLPPTTPTPPSTANTPGVTTAISDAIHGTPTAPVTAALPEIARTIEGIIDETGDLDPAGFWLRQSNSVDVMYFNLVIRNFADEADAQMVVNALIASAGDLVVAASAGILDITGSGVERTGTDSFAVSINGNVGTEINVVFALFGMVGGHAEYESHTLPAGLQLSRIGLTNTFRLSGEPTALGASDHDITFINAEGAAEPATLTINFIIGSALPVSRIVDQGTVPSTLGQNQPPLQLIGRTAHANLTAGNQVQAGAAAARTVNASLFIPTWMLASTSLGTAGHMPNIIDIRLENASFTMSNGGTTAIAGWLPAGAALYPGQIVQVNASSTSPAFTMQVWPDRIRVFSQNINLSIPSATAPTAFSGFAQAAGGGGTVAQGYVQLNHGLAIPMHFVADAADGSARVSVQMVNRLVNNERNVDGARTFAFPVVGTAAAGLVSLQLGASAQTLGSNGISEPRTLTANESGIITTISSAADGESALRGFTLSIGELDGDIRFAAFGTNNAHRPIINFAGRTIPVFASHEAAAREMNLIARNADGTATGAIPTTGTNSFFNPANDIDSDGIITNLANRTTHASPSLGLATGAGVQQQSYAFMSHNNTRLNIVIGSGVVGGGAFDPQGATTRVLNVSNLRFAQQRPWDAVTPGNVNLVVGSDIVLGTNTFGDNIGGGFTWTAVAVNFSQFGVQFNHQGGDNYPHANSHRSDPMSSANTITAGLTRSVMSATVNTGDRPDAALVLPSSPVGGTPAASPINTAGVRLTQTAIQGRTFNPLVAPVTFTIGDSEGNPIDGVTIRGIWLDGGTAGAIPAAQNVNDDNYVRNQIMADSDANIIDVNGDNVRVIFLAGNQSVMITGISSDTTNVLNARFALAVAPGVDAQNVYVMVNSQTLDAELEDNILQVANIRTGVTVEIVPQHVVIGNTEIAVYDFIISETEVGDFRTASTVLLGLQQPFGWGASLVFAPTGNQVQTNQHVSVDNHNNRTRLSATMRIVPQVGIGTADQNAQRELQLTLTRSGIPHANDVPAVITISGMRVINQLSAAPEGIEGLLLSGTSVTNVLADDINFIGTNAQGVRMYLQPNQANYRPWGHSPGVIAGERTLVDEEGTIREVQLPTIVLPFLPSNTFTVNGESVAHYGGSSSVNITPGRVVNGVYVVSSRLYVPLRSIVELGMGGEIEWIPGIGGGAEGSGVAGTLAGRTAFFMVGSQTMSDYQGRTIPMPYGMAAFIGDGTTGVQGRTYVPLRAIALAFGLDIDGSGAAAVLN
jgi:hypothetical protein